MLARLDDDNAWAMALAWRQELQGCVRLEIDKNSTVCQVVDRFEWVTFVFNGTRDDGFAPIHEPVDAAYCARAASIVWFALSCCSGFSGTENPRFWRRVFSELHAPPGHHIIFRRPRAQIHITEAVRFFDHPDRPFPRIRIEPCAQEKEMCLRAFLGYAVESQEKDEEPSPFEVILDALGQLFFPSPKQRRLSLSDLDARLTTHQARLDAILRELTPFIRPSHWRRRLPVAIDGVQATDLAWILPNLKTRPDHHHLALDQLQLESVFLRDDEPHVETAVRALLTKTNINIIIQKVALSRSTSTFRNLVHDCLRQDDVLCDSRLQIGTLTTVFPRGMTFASLCSSLPHTQTIKTVQLDVTSRHIATIIGLRALEWAWFGYAFFHPDAHHNSSFAQLDLDQYRIIDHEVDMLKRMAKGNNLLTFDQDSSMTTPISNYYHSGKIHAGTVVYSHPDDEASPMTTCATERWLTLCVASGQLFSLGTWVCAVVPGHGLGWIRRTRILEIKSRSPMPSCLRGLRLNIESAFGGHDHMLQLLSVVGDRLEYLHIVGRRHPLDTATVGSILRLCPALKSLRICHDGSYWSSFEPMPLVTPHSHLQELEMVIGSYQHLPVLSPLRSSQLEALRALRIVTLAKTSFVSNCETFVDVLTRYPHLQYANWSLGWSHTGCSPLRSYDEHQAASLERFGSHATNLEAFIHLPLHASCRWAFLSVIHHNATSPSSVLGCFGRDIVAIIFAFATSRSPRDVYVDDEVEFVTGHYRN